MENSSNIGSLSTTGHAVTTPPSREVRIPDYLSNHYWWAYLHPKGLKFFDHKWLIDVILWGNYNRLSSVALDELGDEVQGRTLQMACVYGSLTPRLVDRLATNSRLDVIDVANIQLNNLSKKTISHNLYLDRQDATDLDFENDQFDQILIFFLLHELPLDYRKKALAEAMRVVKPGGKLIIVDYHKPIWRNPLRYFMPIVFRLLEPFAIDLWQKEISHWLPKNCSIDPIKKQTYFGGLYQKLVIKKIH